MERGGSSRELNQSIRQRWLKVTIAPNGSVEAVEFLGGNPILGESAMMAVTKWIYAAGPSETKTEISIPFDPEKR